jgi:WD40 repeat protein
MQGSLLYPVQVTGTYFHDQFDRSFPSQSSERTITPASRPSLVKKKKKMMLCHCDRGDENLDGQCIASPSSDCTIIVWDVTTGNIVAGPFTGHLCLVNSVSFSPDGKRVASISYDETVFPFASCVVGWSLYILVKVHSEFPSHGTLLAY